MGLKQGLVALESQAVTFSGTNMDLTGSLVTVNFATTGSITDSTGRYRITNIGSPTTYGGFVQAGFVTTNANSGGTVVFGRQFATNAYALTLTPGSLANGVNTSAFVSGTRNVSGAEIVGGASATYNYIAVGL